MPTEEQNPRPEAAGPPEEDRPDLARLSRWMGRSAGPLTLAVIGLFVLAFFYTLSAASALFLPIVIALLLNFLLSPAVRFLGRRRVPLPLGAALVLLMALGAVGLAVYELSGPAAEWIQRAPESLRLAEYRLRGLRESVEEATQQLEEITELQDEASAQQSVEVQRATMTEALLSQTQQFLAGAVVTVLLLYFLLASGDLFLRKLVHVLPMFRRKRIAVQIARDIERDLSAYLFTYAMINAVLGGVVALGLYLLGMPNPVLWGLLVGVLNFIPYLGPLVGVTILGLVALVSFESTARALAAPALYFTINALEGGLVTPLIMGQRLTLNPVAIFVSLTFWGWIWGIAGALLAVPILVMLKIICDNVATLAPLGEFLAR